MVLCLGHDTLTVLQQAVTDLVKDNIMQTKKFAPTARKFAKLQELAIAIQTGTPSEALQTLQALKDSEAFKGKGWQTNFAKLQQVLSTGEAAYSVFALGGNSKLPFVAFSTLPGVTCPGAGACLNFCYSYRAWRFPASFARMAQNAYLMRHNREAISLELTMLTIKRSEGFDFRLYVDGDFANGADVAFWMETLKQNPTIRAYGYSKSFAALLGYGAFNTWPSNYMLNISSGHNASETMLGYVKQLPIVRGEFIAVSIGKKVKSTDHGTPSTNKALREAFKAKAFTCPGTCGTCTGAGHACGLPQLKGLPIIIAIH